MQAHSLVAVKFHPEEHSLVAVKVKVKVNVHPAIKFHQDEPQL